MGRQEEAYGLGDVRRPSSLFHCDTAEDEGAVAHEIVVDGRVADHDHAHAQDEPEPRFHPVHKVGPRRHLYHWNHTLEDPFFAV